MKNKRIINKKGKLKDAGEESERASGSAVWSKTKEAHTSHTALIGNFFFN